MKLLIAVFLTFIGHNAFTQVSPPGIKWQKCLGGSAYDVGYSLTQAKDGNILILGESASRNGDVTDAPLGPNVWLIKIDTSGNLLWQKTYGGSGTDQGRFVTATADGGCIFTAQTRSNNGDVSGWHGDFDVWVVKVDATGNIQWQRCYGGSGGDYPHSIRSTSDGGYIFIAQTNSTNGDITGSKGGGDPWVVKIDASGNIQWKKNYGNASNNYGEDVRQLPDGNYAITVNTINDGGDFPGTGNNNYRFIARLDQNGNILDRKQTANYAAYGSSLLAISSTELIIADLQNICVPQNTTWAIQATHARFNGQQWEHSYPAMFGSCGNFHNMYMNGNSIVASGADTYLVCGAGGNGASDAFIGQFSLDSTLGKNWHRVFGGSKDDMFHAIVPVGDGEFIAVGFTRSNDGDVSGLHGPDDTDIWVVKFGKTNYVTGTVYRDTNLNGIKDSVEPYVNNILVETEGPGLKRSSISLNGIFTNEADTGTFMTKPIVNTSYYNVVPASKQSVFPSVGQNDTASFGLQPIPGKKDYTVRMFTTSAARPGFPVQYKINYYNPGTVALTTGQLKMIADSRIQYKSAFPQPDSIVADTIIWNIANFELGDTGSITLSFVLRTPPTLFIGDTLVSVVSLDSAGDFTPADNYSVLTQIVTGSYDPNDKQEAHAGYMPFTEVGLGKPLLYTIRFQNTGNDTAFNVEVRDTLSAKLSWTSFEIVEASHPCVTTINDGNKVTWAFSNIQLPDSNINEHASHGYVVFRVKALSTLQIGDTINNSASIYFDFNLPVNTNIQQTTIRPEAPVAPAITGIQSNYCNNLGVQKGKIVNLPANGSGTTISVKIDNNTVPVASDSTFSFNVSNLGPGTHTITVQFSNVTASRISSSNFTITPVVTPDVNVSANITTVTDLATNVIITALNAGGGGNAPLFTFAWDRNFTNFAQAEGPSSTWTLNPTLLTIGDNLIYVRMRSNATCIVTNTAIDSILLKRSMATGITDPDMPGQMIQIFPNPFKEVITINGLSISKRYTIRLSNMEGKVLVNSRLSGRAFTSLRSQYYSNGTYLLSIYDDTRKRILGTVKITKN